VSLAKQTVGRISLPQA